MRRREFLPLLGGGLVGAPAFGKSPSRCILITLDGGPSHLDTWDPKPEAPLEIRGPFRPIRTNVPGIRISEIFPRLARNTDKFSILRGVHNDAAPTHEKAWRSVALPPARLAEPAKLDPEPGRILRSYGHSEFGRKCLRARQMIEAGDWLVRIRMFDTVQHQPTWDSHGYRPFSDFNAYSNVVGPMFDQAFSALLDDLNASGLLRETIVAALPEFGRSPRINSSGGRDHWNNCYSALIGGGPVRCGQVLGSSDTTGCHPKDRPVTPPEIISTICACVQIQAPVCASPIGELLG